MTDTAAPGVQTDEDVFASFDADFDAIVAGEPAAPAEETPAEPEPVETAGVQPEEPESVEEMPEESEQQSAAETEPEQEPSASDDGEVPEPTSQDPQWYQRMAGKVRRQRREARAEAEALRKELEALRSQTSAPAPAAAVSAPAKTDALTQEGVYASVVQELGLDPDTATDFEMRTAHMVAQTRWSAHQNEQRFERIRQDNLRAEVQALESRVAERVKENPFLSREELLLAESRGQDMDEYIADRVLAFHSFASSQGYVRQGEQKKAPPKPMPVAATRGSARKQTAAQNMKPAAQKSYDNDEDFYGDLDAELDKHFTS